MTGHEHIKFGLFGESQIWSTPVIQLYHLVFDYDENHVKHVTCEYKLDSRDFDLCIVFDVLSKISSVMHLECDKV